MTSVDTDDLDAIGAAAAAFVAERFRRHAGKRLQKELDVSSATIDRLKRGAITWPLFGRMVRAYGRGFVDQALAPLLGAEPSSFVSRMVHDADRAHADALAVYRQIAGAPAGVAVGAAGHGLHRSGHSADHAGAVAGSPGHGRAALDRFAGRILEARVLEPAEMVPAHQRLLALIDGCGGEFTAGAADELAASGLDSMTWLYRADAALPVLYVGEAIPIIASGERASVLNRPVAEQPLPPSFLKIVLEHLLGTLTPGSGPSGHRITAEFGARTVSWDRVAHCWDRSGLVSSSCVLVAA